MVDIRQAADEFLANRRIAVTGVSRTPASHGANIVYQRLRDRGYEVFAVNPNAESTHCRAGGSWSVSMATRWEHAPHHSTG